MVYLTFHIQPLSSSLLGQSEYGPTSPSQQIKHEILKTHTQHQNKQKYNSICIIIIIIIIIKDNT